MFKNSLFRETRVRQLHWVAPSVMLSSFVFGLIFAIGHHFFYLIMDGQSTTGHIEQQWVLRIGTGLGFLVKMFWTLAACTAYVQWFWYEIQIGSYHLWKIDTLYGAIYDLSRLFYLNAWPKHLPLVFIAVATWYVCFLEIAPSILTTPRLLPFVSIVTPGVISVESQSRGSSALIPTGEVDFASICYASTYRGRLNAQNIMSTRGLGAIKSLTLTTGKVIPVTHSYPGANISYESDFYGPAMSCSVADSDTFAYINRSISQYEKSRNLDIYIASFIPDTGFGPDINATYFNQTNFIRDDAFLAWPGTDLVSSDISKTYVRIRHSSTNFTLYSCDLYNATYSTQFNLYTTGQQDIISKTKLLNPIAIKDYMSVLRPNGTHLSPENIIRTYIAISTTVNGQIGGALWTQHDQPAEASLTSIPVHSTSLKVTFNLTGLNNVIPLYEEVFRNLTISARYGLLETNFGFSKVDNFERCRLNSTVNATLSVLQNQFVYHPRDLIISYGIGIFVTAVCICLGGYAMLKSGGSFSSNFSTVFRYVQNAQFDLDRDGIVGGNADPLPKDIGRLNLTYKNE